MTARKALAILGSTGSVGTSTLNVVARHPERFEVVALAAGRNHEMLLEQCIAFRPRWAYLADAGVSPSISPRESRCYRALSCARIQERGDCEAFRGTAPFMVGACE